MWQFVTEQQWDWEEYIQTLAYDYIIYKCIAWKILHYLDCGYQEYSGTL